MNLELLENEFQVSDNPGLGTLDPRFVDIAGMVQSSDFSGAADRARAIIQDEIYDIRIISYFLYGSFDETGPGSFKDIFHFMGKILRENWEAVGPVKNREKHAKNSLNWFFKQAHKILESEQRKGDEKWQRWLSDTSADDIHEAVKIGKDLQQDIREVLGEQSVLVVDGISKTLAWLETYYRLIYREPEEPLESEKESAFESQEDDGYKEGRGVEKDASFNKAGAYLSGSVSYPLQMLLKKMDRFEQLISENKNTGAAMVAYDINDIIANFDPQLYFPHLFSKFTRQFALHTEELLSFDGCRDSAIWQAMEKLYHVDLESFVAMDNGFHNKNPGSFHSKGVALNETLKNGSSGEYEDEETDYDDENEDY